MRKWMAPGLLIATAALLLLAGCNKGGAKGAAGAPSAPPQPSAAAQQQSTVPDEVMRFLPIDANYEILSFSEDKTAYYLTAQSKQDAMTTAGALLKSLSDNGFSNLDNPSRILEGSEFEGGNGRFKRMYVKASLDADSKCIVEITAYK